MQVGWSKKVGMAGKCRFHELKISETADNYIRLQKYKWEV